MTKMTPTGQARGPLEMHHYRGATPELTEDQRGVIETNRRATDNRRARSAPVVTGMDPFGVFPAPEPNPFT